MCETYHIDMFPTINTESVRLDGNARLQGRLISFIREKSEESLKQKISRLYQRLILSYLLF